MTLRRRAVLLAAGMTTGLAALSCICYLAQGGYLGGSGQWDRVIAIGELPWGQLLDALDPAARLDDFVALILLPWLLNTAFAMALAVAIASLAPVSRRLHGR